MSFSQDVKEDILKNNLDLECNLIELEGFLRNSYEVILGKPLKLSFFNTNMRILRYIISLIKKFYLDASHIITSKTQTKLKNQTFYICEITNMADTIIEDLSLFDPITMKKDEILEEPKFICAYLRGAFLAKGSVNAPNTSNYHLEISTDKETEALFLQRIMNYYELNARISKRRNNLIVYIKEKDRIVEFLRRIGSNVLMNEFENILIKREISANVNRTMNIDVANQQRTNKSSKEQLRYIKYIEYNYPLEKLDPKLLMVMKVRKENPEASLTEMISIINEVYDEKITKSGLNHRLRKLKEIAVDYEERKNEVD